MDEIVSAIKALRTRLGDSQQTFANRLGLSMRAIANYESGRHPTVVVLRALVVEASQNGHRDLSDVFKAAYADTMKGVIRPTNDEETAWVRLVLTLLRNKDLLPELTSTGTSLIGALESLLALGDTHALKTQRDELEETLVWARHQIMPTADQKLHRMASKRSSSTGESYHQARAALLVEDPDLYQEYRAYQASLQPSEDPTTIPEPKSRSQSSGAKEASSKSPEKKRKAGKR